MKPIRKIIGGSLPRIVYHDSNGKLHRTDGPACIYLNGRQYWQKHGPLHRDNSDVTGILPDGQIFTWHKGMFLGGGFEERERYEGGVT